MGIDSTGTLSRHHARQKMMMERRGQRERKVRIRLDRMPEETAREYIEHYERHDIEHYERHGIEHYERHGIEHFKPAHCPEKFRAEVLAHFRRAA